MGHGVLETEDGLVGIQRDIERDQGTGLFVEHIVDQRTANLLHHPAVQALEAVAKQRVMGKQAFTHMKVLGALSRVHENGFALSHERPLFKKDQCP
ncbi:hypothetical protein D3C71_1882220 [compost metagenome]